MQQSPSVVSQITFCNAGVPVTADTILHTPFESLAASAAAAEEAGLNTPEPAGAEPMAVDAEQASAAGSPEEPGRSAAQSTILSRLLEELIHHSKPEVGLQCFLNACKNLRMSFASNFVI